MPSPDHYGPRFSQIVGGARPSTPPAMGGTVVGQNHDRAAAAQLLQGRQAPDVDERASAAVQRWWAERFARKIILRGSGVGAGAGFVWVACGYPSDGYTWAVRRLNVGPVDHTTLPWATGVTTMAAVATGQQPPTGSASADVIVSTTTAWPASATWGSGELTLESGDTLWVAVAGIAVGVPFTVGGEARETAAGVPEVYGL